MLSCWSHEVSQRQAFTPQSPEKEANADRISHKRRIVAGKSLRQLASMRSSRCVVDPESDSKTRSQEREANEAEGERPSPLESASFALNRQRSDAVRLIRAGRVSV